MDALEIAGAFILTLILGTFFLWYRIRRKTSVTVDGCTIRFWRGRDFAWVMYREPSGRNLTLEAHPLRLGTQSSLLVEMPDQISFYEGKRPEDERATPGLNIPDTPSSPVSKEETSLVRERISKGLNRMEIQYEFVRPRRSGWTSLEDGKEIYHC
jgi:hypothetical protein